MTTTTRYPALADAVLAQTDADSLADVARHGADAGFPGFTYYSDTVAFFQANKRDILAMLRDLASDMGEDALAVVAGFVCLRDLKLTADDVAQAIYADGEHSVAVKNALAWYALEEIARELNPDA